MKWYNAWLNLPLHTDAHFNLSFRVTRLTAVESWKRKGRTHYANWTNTNVVPVGHEILKVICNGKVKGSISSSQNGVYVEKRQPQISTWIRNIRISKWINAPSFRIWYNALVFLPCGVGKLPTIFPLCAAATFKSLPMNSLLDEWHYSTGIIRDQ